MKTNYYAVILSNGYLEDVCTSREEAEKKASSINRGDYSGSDYVSYAAKVVRGLKNIQREVRGNWTMNQIKMKAEGLM